MSSHHDPDDLRDEYDFTAEVLRGGVRGKYEAGYGDGTNLIPLDPDDAAVLPNVSSGARSISREDL